MQISRRSPAFATGQTVVDLAATLHPLVLARRRKLQQ
jgi:hypothetical protein